MKKLRETIYLLGSLGKATSVRCAHSLPEAPSHPVTKSKLEFNVAPLILIKDAGRQHVTLNKPARDILVLCTEMIQKAEVLSYQRWCTGLNAFCNNSCPPYDERCSKLGGPQRTTGTSNGEVPDLRPSSRSDGIR